MDLPSVTDTPLRDRACWCCCHKDSAFSSPPGFNMLFADGRVHFIPKRNLTEQTLRAFITRNGKEQASELDY